jgi:KUP system potassium uptake protein
MMTTWSTGRSILAERIAERTSTVVELVARLEAKPPLRVPGTAIYLGRDPTIAPHALLQNLKHNKVVHERVVLLALLADARARLSDDERVRVERMSASVFSVVLSYGFAEDAQVPSVIEQLRHQGLSIDLAESTFFLGRETLLATNRPGMALWREHLFALMSRNARRATKFFRLPSDRVVELGTEIEL